jgi:hypothetical protein
MSDVQVREGLATGSMVVVDATLFPRLGKALEKLDAQLAEAIRERDEARMQMAAKDRLLISSATENAALRAEVERLSASIM